MYNISSGENIQYDELSTGFKVIGSTTTYDSINVKPKESSETNLILSKIEERKVW